MTNKAIKWMALAVLIVGLTGFLVGQQITPDKKQATTQASSRSDVGRYQVVFNPNVRADTFLVDTSTGRTWVQTAITDVEDEPTVWMYRERIDSATDFMLWSVRQKPKKSESEAK